MKKKIWMIVLCCIGFFSFAGDISVTLQQKGTLNVDNTTFHVRFCQATFVTFFQFFLYSKRNSPYPCNHRCRFLLKSKLIVSLFLFFKRYFLALHTGSG